MASGHVNRIYRPNTWLHRPMLTVHTWHETDMPKYLGDVRCWVNSGKHLLSLSFSGFDPKRTSTLLGARFRLEGYDNSRVRLLPRQRGQCK